MLKVVAKILFSLLGVESIYASLLKWGSIREPVPQPNTKRTKKSVPTLVVLSVPSNNASPPSVYKGEWMSPFSHGLKIRFSGGHARRIGVMLILQFIRWGDKYAGLFFSAAFEQWKKSGKHGLEGMPFFTPIRREGIDAVERHLKPCAANY